LVLKIFFLLFGDGERVGWNHFLFGGSIENAGNNYGVSILTGLTIWRLLFSNDDIKVEMVSPSWNSFFLVSSLF